MSHHFQFLDAQGEPLSPTRLDDDICRNVLHREPDPDGYCREFVLLTVALMHGIQPLGVLENIRALFTEKESRHRDRFAAVLGYVVGRGITGHVSSTFDFVSPN